MSTGMAECNITPVHILIVHMTGVLKDRFVVMVINKRLIYKVTENKGLRIDASPNKYLTLTIRILGCMAPLQF